MLFVSDVSGPHYTLFIQHIRLRPSSFFSLHLASSDRPKDQKSNDVVKPFFTWNNSFNLRNEHSNSIEKNRNKNRNIFYSILCILLIQGDKNLLCLQQKEKTRCGNASRITSVQQSGEERFFYNRRGNVHLRRSSLSSQYPSTGTFSKSCSNPSDAGLQQFKSAVCTAVEWLFWEVISYFQCLDFKKNLKIQWS